MKLDQEVPETEREGEMPSTSGTTPTQDGNQGSSESRDVSHPGKPQHHSTEKPKTPDATGAKGNNTPAQKQTPDPQASSTASADYVTPPDGGWGWLVVFSSFMIHVIADGIVYSFGVFLTELVDYFNAGRGEITWVGSLQPALTFTVGKETF